ncbi:hypothetical protein MJO29_012055, partial [Puccinia striiformis f. sp. tritici]
LVRHYIPVRYGLNKTHFFFAYRNPFQDVITVILSFMCSLVSAGGGAPRPGQSATNVQGTYWNGATFAGSCLLSTSYYGQSPPRGIEYVAVAGDINGMGQYCGACLKISSVRGKASPVIAMVSSHCPNCPSQALDMPGTLFDKLMGNAPGRPGVNRFNWEVVACPIANRLPQLKNKQGSSRYSLSMLFVDTKYPVQSVVITSGRRVFEAYKRDYNYWEIHNSGEPLDPKVDVKVTCTNSRSFIMQGVDPGNMASIPARSGC